MKRLTLLLCVCCIAFACEEFEIPEIEIDKKITRSDMNGYYQNVMTQYIRYKDGVAVGFELAAPSQPWPIDRTEYFALTENEVYYYLVTKYTPPVYDVVQAFISDGYSSPIDLDNLKMATGKDSYKSDIQKLTTDTIILLEPVAEAMKRCKSNKDYTRSYDVYVKIAPDRDLIKTFYDAFPISQYMDFWNGYFKDKQ